LETGCCKLFAWSGLELLFSWTQPPIDYGILLWSLSKIPFSLWSWGRSSLAELDGKLESKGMCWCCVHISASQGIALAHSYRVVNSFGTSSVLLCDRRMR
jgi:hypothetical protein